MAQSQASKVRLLCLHGYMQNAEVFKSKIGSMRKALKSRVEFVFIDGPFEAQGLPGANPDEDAEEVGGVGSNARSWWQWADVGPAGRPSKAAHYQGWELSWQALVRALEEHRPDGLLGFSQGATAVALLLASLGQGVGGEAGRPDLMPKFAIMVAGFLPRDPSYADIILRGRPSLPSLFVTGDADQLVPPERSQQLVDAFDPRCARLLRHPGAHFVPTCSGQTKQSLVGFLDWASSEHQLQLQPLLQPQEQVASPPASAGGASGSAAAVATEVVA